MNKSNFRKWLIDWSPFAIVLLVLLYQAMTLYSRSWDTRIDRISGFVQIMWSVTLLAILWISNKSLHTSQRQLENEKVINLAITQIEKLQAELSEKSPSEALRSLNHWPWGSHHTEALGHLEAAARRFWKLYDPGDISTAPTNEMVADWLKEERGISKEKARAIASMLRPDGLPTGPRR